MKQPVTLLFFTQAIECETCDETKRILAELTEVTDKIVVEEVNLVLDKERAATYGIERAPALVLLTNGQDTRIRFFGAPAGYDFMAMVDAILAVSGASDIGPLGRERRARLRRDRADAHPGVRDADLRLLPARRRPREPYGAPESEHHFDDRRRNGVLRAGTEVPRHRRSQDRRQRIDRSAGRVTGT